jgi:hypothetical protein
MRKHFTVLIVLGCAFALAGCTNPDNGSTHSPDASSVDQSSVCEVKDWGPVRKWHSFPTVGATSSCPSSLQL